MEAEADALMARTMPDAFAQMLKARQARASIPAPKPEPPTLAVGLIDPESLKPNGPAETMLANAAVLAQAAMVLSYQRGMAAHGALGDAYLTQGARQALTLTASLGALMETQGVSTAANRVDASKANRRVYMRDFMRRKRALQRAERAQRLLA